jgi:hypothetical protein
MITIVVVTEGRPRVVDGTPSQLADGFYEGKVPIGSHGRETF